MVHLTWECQELQEQLAASIEANHQLTDEERRLLEKRLAALQRDLHHVIEKKEVLEKHLQPSIEALLQQYHRLQQTATQAGMPASTHQAPSVPYRQQLPAGYGE